tara:strand:+ start:18012 stop:19148 length:1137 start_codon:yes stop_codon:yes gene_type:complete
MTRRIKSRINTALVLQGGGARGAYQIGVLKAVAEIEKVRRTPFSIISGASVGAINAAPLAASSGDFQHGVHHLEKLWRGLHCNNIYHTHATAIAASSARWLCSIAFGGLGIGHPWALLDNTPLKHLLERETNWRHLHSSIRRGTLDALCITASSYAAGQAVTWFMARDSIDEWKRAKRIGIRTEIGTNHLMASSALPFVFPAVRVEEHYYGDGSLRLTAPLSAPIRMGADRLFIISVRDKHVGPQEGKEQGYPSMGEMAGHALDIMFNDNLESDHERLRRINDTLSRMSSRARKDMPLRMIDTKMISPSRDLRVVASEHTDEMPNSIRLLLRSLGSWGKDDRLVSYLLFEPGYVGALIDLGYKDAMDQKDDIASFLHG